MEIHKENSPPQIVQMVISHDLKELDSYNISDFSHREHYANPDTDSVRILHAPIDNHMLVFVLRHINDVTKVFM